MKKFVRVQVPPSAFLTGRNIYLKKDSESRFAVFATLRFDLSVKFYGSNRVFRLIGAYIEY